MFCNLRFRAFILVELGKAAEKPIPGGRGILYEDAVDSFFFSFSLSRLFTLFVFGLGGFNGSPGFHFDWQETRKIEEQETLSAE